MQTACDTSADEFPDVSGYRALWMRVVGKSIDDYNILVGYAANGMTDSQRTRAKRILSEGGDPAKLINDDDSGLDYICEYIPLSVGPARWSFMRMHGPHDREKYQELISTLPMDKRSENAMVLYFCSEAIPLLRRTKPQKPPA